MSKTVKLDDKYHIEVFSDCKEIVGLKRNWDTLACKHNIYQPWFMYAWFSLSWKHFSKSSGPYVITLVSEGELVLIAPFITKKERYKGLCQVKKVEVLGSHYSPIGNVIFASKDMELRREWLTCLFRFLSTESQEWNVIEIDALPNEDGSSDLFRATLADLSISYHDYFCYNNVYLDSIDYDGAEYLKRRSKNTRQQVGKKKRRLERQGALEIRIFSAMENFDFCVNAYYSVRSRSWKAPELDSTFHRDFWKFAARMGWFRCGLLLYNQTVIATLIVIVYGKKAYLLETNYDQEFSEWSPGLILNAEVVTHLIDKDCVTELDTMKGDEPYKKSWFPKERDRFGLVIFSNDIKGKILCAITKKCLPLFENSQVARFFKRTIIKGLQFFKRV